MHRFRREEFRYLVVGGFNVCFTLGVFWLLDMFFSTSIGVQPVYWISALLGIANGFIWQRLLVWKSRNQWHAEFLRFLALNLAVSVCNSFLLFLAVDVFALLAFPSQVVITGVLVILTFLATKTWVFNRRRPHGSAS